MVQGEGEVGSKSFSKQRDGGAKATPWLALDLRCFPFLLSFFRSEAVRDDSGSVHE